MSRPPASIANTSPPETIGAVSSRRRLASPSPRSTDQISCGTGLSAGLSSRFGRAPLRFGHSAFITAPGIATGRARDGLAAGVSSGRTAIRSPGRIGS